MACQDQPYEVSRLRATDQAPRLNKYLVVGVDPHPGDRHTPTAPLGHRDPPGRPVGLIVRATSRAISANRTCGDVAHNLELLQINNKLFRMSLRCGPENANKWLISKLNYSVIVGGMTPALAISHPTTNNRSSPRPVTDSTTADWCS